MIFYRDELETYEVILGGQTYNLRKARLGKYLELLQIRKGPKNSKTILQYLSTALGVPQNVFSKSTGLEMLQTCVAVAANNQLTNALPMLAFTNPDRKPEHWDYDNRFAVTWVHTLCRTYSWTRQEVLDLDINEAAAYLQEIAIDEQMSAEWDHRLSPNAYQDDPDGKVKRFKPLQRPGWMILPAVQPAHLRIPVLEEFLPKGNVISMASLLSASRNVSPSSS